jgi:hypothetical protein
MRPSSGEINAEVGDCEDAVTSCGAGYRYRVTGAADALLMDGESTLCLCDRDGLGADRFRECPHLENREMGPPILWRVQVWANVPLFFDQWVRCLGE